MRTLRALLHATCVLTRAVAHAVAGWFSIVFVFPRLDAAQRARRVQAWALKMLEVLDIGLETHGESPAHGPLLLVANHISWLDILVIHATGHCRFVSKSDVRRWPLIGTLATGGGTLYIERASRRDAQRVVHHMAQSLSAGDILAVFPEGTTTDGRSMLPFHANLLQAAVSAGALVQPVGLRYLDVAGGGNSEVPSYIGDDSLAGSLWRTVTGPRFLARVAYGEPQPALGRNRRVWAGELHQVVAALRSR